MTISRGLFALAVCLALWALGGTGAQAQGVHLHANLKGGNEVAGGDEDGFGTAAVQFQAANRICVAILVSKITTPTAAHIHRGFAPDNGPVVVPLEAPAAGNPGGSTFCATISVALANEIKKNPAQFYVNVHTSDHSGGAVRGQLF